jgi:predicted RND superfamily exporter protein
MKNPFITYYHIVTVIVLFLIIFAGLTLYRNQNLFLYSGSTDSIMKGDTRTTETTGFIAQSLENDTWMAFVFQCDDILKKENLEKYFLLCQKLRECKGYRGSLGLENILVPKVMENGKLRPRFELLIHERKYENNNWEEIKKNCKETSYINNVLLTEDYKNATLLSRFSIELNTREELEAFICEIDQKIKEVATPQFKISKIGLPVLKKEIQDSILNNLFFKGGIALSLIILCLMYICRRIVYFFNLLISVLISFICLFFLIMYFSVPIDFYLLLLLPIIATVQLTFLVHLYIVMQKMEKSSVDLSFSQIADLALKEIIKPSISSCLMTATGFLSFSFSPLEELRFFGALGGIATLVVLFISYGPGVSLLIAFNLVNKPKKVAMPDKELRFFTNIKFSLLPAIILIGITLCSVYYLTKIKTDERILQYLPNKSEMKEGLNILSEKFGGIHMFKLEIDSGKKNGVNDLQLLAYLNNIHGIAEKYKSVSAVYSYSQLISQVNDKFLEAMSNSQLSFLKGLVSPEVKVGKNQIPSPLVMATITNILQIYNPSGLELLLDSENKKTTMFIRTIDMPSEEYVALIKEILKDSEAIKPASFKINLVEGIHSYLEKENQIKSSWLSSYLTGFIPIFCIMMYLFRSFTLSFFAFFINSSAVIIMLGFTGFMGISLNSITVLAGAITFGVAVDDSIHLISQFQFYRRQMSKEEALQKTFEKKNRAVIGTSLLVICASIFLYMINFTPISNFGLVTLVSMSAALLLNLFVLPFCLRLTK